MKKRSKCLFWLLCALIGLGLDTLFNLMLARIPGLSSGEKSTLYFFCLAMVYVFCFLELILHEAGHLIFGLATGWRFVSFRIANMMWLRGADGRIRRARFSLAGTVGQCLLAPPPWQEEDFPCQLYNLGGVIVNLLTAVICGLLA